MAKSPTMPQESTAEHIRERTEETILGPPAGDYGGFGPIWKTIVELVQAAPGTEKSKIGTWVANELWDRHGRPTLYLMLTHKAIEERLKFIAEDGKLDNWCHFRGHDKGCDVRKWAKVGYFGAQCGGGKCQRDTSSLDAKKPTLAAFNVILNRDLSDRPIHHGLNSYPLWIMDEVDLSKLNGEFTATEKDLGKVAAKYPQEFAPVKQLVRCLRKLIDKQRLEELPERLNSHQLYEELEHLLPDEGTTLSGLLEQLKPLTDKLPTGQWANSGKFNGKPARLSDQPRNFPRYLVPIFCAEAYFFLHSRRFNPRIHLVNQGNRAPLQLRWRLEVQDRWPGVNSLLVLDATADGPLLKYWLGVKECFKPELPPWPPNVYVHQWGDSTVSKAKLGFHGDDDDATIDDQALLETWFERIRQALDKFNRSWSVGVVTHKGLHTQLEEKVRSWGFRKVRSMYFHDLRGSNEFQKSRIQVILGCPIPNMTGFEEECQGFFWDYDRRPLDFQRANKTLEIVMRSDPKYPAQKYPVNVFGYWTPPVSIYYQQKCEAELYQACHRIRPYIQKPYKRHIFLFTNMPMPGVEVDEIMVDTASNRNYQVAQKVKEVLSGQDEISVKELVLLLGEQGATRSIEKRIGNNGESIAVLAGAWYHRGTPGKGGTSNRFAKAPL